MAGLLGCCENINVFAINLAALALCIYTMFVYRMGMLTTMEKRFNLSSTETGFAQSSFEIGHLITIFLLTYYGRHCHIPRILGIAALSTVISGIFASVPHFYYGSAYKVTTEGEVNGTSSLVTYGSVCVNKSFTSDGNTTSVSPSCDGSGEPTGRRYPEMYAIMLISTIVIGAALVPVVTLGITYLDSNITNRKRAPLYLGLTTGMMSSGAFLGFIWSAVAARIYESPEEPWPEVTDPKWIGAWWLGNLAMGGLTAVTVLTFLLFPRALIEQTSTAIKADPKEKKTKVQACLGIFTGFKKLITNPLFVAHTMGYTLDAYLWSGMMPFLAKLLQVQFRQPAFVANLMAAVMSGLACATGNFSGGIVASRVRSRRSLLGIMVGASSISTIGMLVVMNIKCDLPPDGTGSCSPACECSVAEFSPVCGSDGADYVSPCHAGCSANSTLTDGRTNFTDCSCPGAGGWASEGLCETSCNIMYPYGIILFILVAMGDFNTPPNLALVIRVVDDDIRSFALGIFNASLSLLGFVPGPNIYGPMVDSICTVWQTDSCGNRGSCLTYDVPKLRYVVFGFTAMFKSVGLMCYIYLLVRARHDRSAVMDQRRENGEVQEEQTEMLAVGT